MTNYFGYYEGLNELPEGSFKISPSRLSRFLDSTSGWYRECVLGEGAAFTGSTASHLGTVVHGLAEMYHKTGVVDYVLAEAYIDSINDPEVDKAYIRSQYPGMSQLLNSQFVANKGGKSEVFLHHEIIPGFVVGGSVDLLLPDEVVDYKTTNSKTAPTAVKREYWFQQMAYVWMARQKGMNISRFRLVYITTADVNRISETTGKPLKDYPSTISSVVHDVTAEDLEIIDSVLRLVAESVRAYKEKPELRHLLAQDMRLKEHTSIFKKVR